VGLSWWMLLSAIAVFQNSDELRPVVKPTPSLSFPFPLECDALVGCQFMTTRTFSV
jgi:hypothetical protein